MLRSFQLQLAAGMAITRSQAARAYRFIYCFLKFLHHHHRNEDGEFGTLAWVLPASSLFPKGVCWWQACLGGILILLLTLRPPPTLLLPPQTSPCPTWPPASQFQRRLWQATASWR